MKKIYYLQKIEVELGDLIAYKGFKTTVTEELIKLNPELFKVEESIQPIYFKALKGIKPFTTGRVYKQVDSIGYPTTIKLIADDNKEWTIYNWQSDYLHLNNNCFELTTKAEWDKQELLDEAKRRYPIGTVYKHFNSEYTINSPDMLTVSEMDHHFEGNNSFETSIWVKSEEYNGVVYADGEWAEILPLKFTTEDGVSIYGDMKTYLVHPDYNTDICFNYRSWDGNSECKSNKYFYHKENALAYIEKNKVKFLTEDGIKIYERMPTYRISKKDLMLNKYSCDFWLGDNENYKYFFHRENALAYIEKHKEKTLEDYENMLLKYDIDSINAREVCWFYRTLKGKEPKLYYAKILQLIADDLNDGWVADSCNQQQDKYYFANHYKKHTIEKCVVYIHQGAVLFKSIKLIEKAKDILGEKIEYI